jgi:hypothetical protein
MMKATRMRWSWAWNLKMKRKELSASEGNPQSETIQPKLPVVDGEDDPGVEVEEDIWDPLRLVEGPNPVDEGDPKGCVKGLAKSPILVKSSRNFNDKLTKGSLRKTTLPHSILRREQFS